KQGQSQTIDAKELFTEGDVTAPIDLATITLLDVNNQPATTVSAMKDGQEVGTYSIDPATGLITFQPSLDFVGEPDAVKIQAKDKNGTVVETSYTPTVEIVTPTGEVAETIGKQGQLQTTDAKGNTIHIYKKIINAPKVNESVKENIHYKKMLPNTGESDKVFLPQALLSILLSMTLLITSKKNKKKE
ncbi:LPXTG cell wall anchor domain-containing protein, partial [Streptococcus marimammalium]|uniref:LPXTG cell wall anchor domain-containing protein n=1 Tax=Streptococcus marimammalium TaxID=269666 RepID=UPI00047603D0